MRAAQGVKLRTGASTVHTSPFCQQGRAGASELRDAGPPQRRKCANIFQEPGEGATCIHCRAKQNEQTEHVDAVRNTSESLRGNVISRRNQFLYSSSNTQTHRRRRPGATLERKKIPPFPVRSARAAHRGTRRTPGSPT